jgi:LacI family transcriptional regulator
VSRALSRPGLVNEATRQRVLAIAAEYGYQANASARGLATGRTMALALLVPDITNPFYPELIRGAENRAEQAGYSLLLCETGEHADREQRLLWRVTGQVDGVIVCSPRSEEAGLVKVAQAVPTVLFNRAVRRIPSVSCLAGPGMAELVSHLVRLGHREVAYLQGPRASWSNKERLSAVRAAAHAHNVALHVLGPYLPTLEGGRNAAEDIASTGATAALAFDDLTAIGVIGRLWELGLHVPNDVSVTGCDDIFYAALFSPPLTTVRSATSAAGATAVEILLERIGAAPSARARHVELVGDVVVRASTAPVR